MLITSFDVLAHDGLASGGQIPEFLIPQVPPKAACALSEAFHTAKRRRGEFVADYEKHSSRVQNYFRISRAAL